jgi:hypothetical protein
MKSTKAVYMLLLGMVVLAMAIVAYRRTVNPTHSVTLDADGIAEQLRGMNDLVTVKYVVQKVVAPHGDTDPSEPMFMVQATVSAAVNLKELKSGDVRVDGNTVDIRLPAAGITDTLIDESQTKVWDHEVGMWTPRASFDTLSDAGVRKDAVGWVERQAEQSGILTDATRTAQQAIERMLLGSGMEKVTFRASAAAGESTAARAR